MPTPLADGVDLGMLGVVAVVIFVSRLLGRLLTRIGQPRIVGEIVAGIVLGPSVLGVLAPEVAAHLFPPDVVSGLRLLADVGLVLFTFLVGVEVAPGHARTGTRRIVAVGAASVAVPFALGVLLALAVHDRVGDGVERVEFVLFVGTAMGITAFPVLARILQETGLFHTSVGRTTITCAAVNDLVAWCLLAVVLVVAGMRSTGDLLVMGGHLVGFLAVMLGVVKPLLHRLAGPSTSASAALVLMLASAAATELIGVHAAVGSFLAGLVIPRGGEWASAVHHQLQTVSIALFLPVVFVVVGLSTEIGVLDTAPELLLAGLVVLIAILGKLSASLAAARLTGASWHEAAVIGVLMNARGLTEIVILQVGLELGLIGPTMFTVMVLMALSTTVMTTPLIRLLGGVSADTRSTTRPQ